MRDPTERAAQWMYRGLWSILVDWFRVPDRPPSLPVRDGDFIHRFQPDLGFLRYLKFFFWLALLAIDIPLTIGWLVLLVSVWWLGLLLAPVAWFIIIAPDIVAFIAIHLRFDTTWYVMTDRSLRLRRGIWVIREVTITFENVQNIFVSQGPVQRYFGISDLIVLTAGGGVAGPNGQEGTGHRGIVEGISASKAAELRERILEQLRSSPTAGLGDEAQREARRERVSPRPAWTAAQVAALREIRDATRSLARRP